MGGWAAADGADGSVRRCWAWRGIAQKGWIVHNGGVFVHFSM